MMIKELKYSCKPLIGILCLCITSLHLSCTKDWLEAKPDRSLVVPATIADYQVLLDNSEQMNGSYPGLGVVGDDNYYVTNTTYQGLTIQEKSAYIWADTEDFYNGSSASDWQNTYARILRENIVLDGIKDLQVDPALQMAYNNVKGSALFHRGLDFYNLAQLYCKPYDNITANTDLGLPLRTTSNVNLSIGRSTVQQTYDQVINDVLQAIPLLPVTPLVPTRPSKPAAYGLLSRIYLSIEDYDKALMYADSCLQLFDRLLDYSKLNPAAVQPISRFNNEVIFHSNLSSYGVFRNTRLIIDPELYQSYEPDDLRPGIFFTTVSGNKSFKGSYDGTLLFFGGLATDEIYLNRAECYARAGKVTEAMSDLNTLLKTRWKKNNDGSSTYIDRTAADKDQALSLILRERRKELCFRGLRWTDLRRLNRDDRFKTIVTRTLDNRTYTLLPGSPRYVLPIDDKEILLGGLQQNPR